MLAYAVNTSFVVAGIHGIDLRVTGKEGIFDMSESDGEQIDVSFIDSDLSRGDDDAFTLVASFSGTASKTVIQASCATSNIAFDTTGDGRGNREIFVVETGLEVNDFVL